MYGRAGPPTSDHRGAAEKPPAGGHNGRAAAPGGARSPRVTMRRSANRRALPPAPAAMA
jgi:hypothetical protein